ncbi:TraR/DksA family transcriptional regulator [Erythrobacter sp. EC-HK427]|uniref:TraR/DksA family transcriptional regulator n=1 Tax=Erythrobacter sp. EC-HK427 TaxID=2038396 RepID=UPI001251DE6B|nr:TraR/DksA family transcriptional regulator [Erythrobacter sp. EC-HK427]VVT06628.1 Conjugal transfer protein TraR [Erythrobacter sp. EC-HK427]
MAGLDSVKAQLEAQLADLQERLQRIERDLDEPHDPDSSERAVQMEDDEALEAKGRLMQSSIASIERALLRIERGEYGECVQCGAQISEGRLAARPEAALCITCASAE